MARYGMSVDVVRCIGCQACLVACKTENQVADGVYRLRIRTTVVGTYPKLVGEFRVEQCFHCENAPCTAVCPTGATFRSPDGIVLVDQAKCIGCKACVTSCPYSMRFVNPDGHAEKCTFCQHRVAQGDVPACVETCPTGARAFGDLDDPKSKVSQAIAAAKTVGVIRPETGAKPKLFYLNSRFTNKPEERGTVTLQSAMRGGE